MMFAVGCIQALRCNTNHCPAGVATQDPQLYKFLDVKSKAERTYRYHKTTLEELRHLLSASGVEKISHISKKHIKRRIGPGKIMSYYNLYPSFEPNSLVENKADEFNQGIWERSSADVFYREE
jgi:hypothetical protein